MFGDPPKQLPQHFAVVMVPEFTMMPVTSAIEPLRIANRLSEKTLYKWTMHSVDGQPVAASNDILAMVDGDLSAIPEDATILICAGLNVQRHTDKRLVAWLRKVARKGTDIGAVCTGAHILAEAGLLDGYKCTIHWENLPGFTEAFPEIDATGGLFEIDRDRFTSAGGTTALDMMLTLIASQHGPELASAVAEGILHSPIRHHSEHQRMSLPARIGARHPKLVGIIEEMEKNLEEPLSPSILAKQAGPFDAPARAAVPPLSRPQPEALLPRAPPQEGALAAAADRHVGDQRGAGLRLLIAVAFLEMLPRLLWPHALPRARHSGDRRRRRR